MRILLIALALGLTLSTAEAQTAEVTRIDVVEYGLYTAQVMQKSTDANGVAKNTVTDIRHAVTTRTVPAQLGVHFGFRYTIVGTPEGAPVELTKVTIYPPEGVKKPSAPEPLHRTQYTLERQIGETKFTDYSFDDPWELVPGTWTMELWVGSRRLAAESFTVVRP
jgi:hypothetical protein